MTILLLALFIPALAQADDRLWGTWEGFDPVEEATLILTFSEDGTFAMSSPELQGEEFSFENMFEDMLTDLEMSLDDLKKLGFEEPTIDRCFHRRHLGCRGRFDQDVADQYADPRRRASRPWAWISSWWMCSRR